MAGVSKKTVSRVINRSPSLKQSTLDKVDAVIQAAGYTPNPQARALALRRNFLIGLVHDNPNAQLVLGVQQGLLDVLADTEYELIVRPVNRGSTTMVDDIRQFLQRQRLHGIVILPPISENEALAALCEELGCRYVRMGSARLDDDDRMVSSNDHDVVRDATRYLIELGHRQIGFVAGPTGFRSAFERRAGFDAALHESGLSLADSHLAEGTYRFESGLTAGNCLLDATPRPTAIFSCNDEMAAGVFHAARERGLDVPGDLSIIGFDDTAIAGHLWPPLTTIRWPIAAMTRAAAYKLLAGTPDANDRAAAPSRFEPTLIRRRSVAPPRQ
jgi:LacI family transcriptional regulator